MFKNILIATAALAAVGAATSAPANAKVNLDIYLGGGGPGYYEPAYPTYEPAYPVYEEPRYHERRRRHEGSYGISCGQGSREVSSAGFNRVRPIDCEGRSYSYSARKHGKRFVVVVSRRSGDIVSVDRSW